MNFKVVIAGGRNFENYELLKSNLDIALSKRHPNVTIISGCARGADSLGERYAEEKGYTILRMPADWDKYGRSAGYKRNELMVKEADAVVCFWDSKSPGTKHTIDITTNSGKPLIVINY